jgi:hypothetical protein
MIRHPQVIINRFVNMIHPQIVSAPPRQLIDNIGSICRIISADIEKVSHVILPKHVKEGM